MDAAEQKKLQLGDWEHKSEAPKRLTVDCVDSLKSCTKLSHNLYIACEQPLSIKPFSNLADVLLNWAVVTDLFLDLIDRVDGGGVVFAA